MTAIDQPARRPPLDPRLVRRARATIGYLAACIAIGATTAACVIATAWLLSRVIAAVFAGGATPSELGGLLALLAGVLGLRALLASVQESAAHYAAAAVKAQLRRQALERLMRLPSGSRNSGEDTALLVRGVDALDAYFARYLPQLVLAVIVPVTVLTVLAFTHPLAALIVALTLPLIPVFGILIGLYTRARARRQWDATAALARHFADLVAGLPTLKAFGRAGLQADRLAATTGEYRKRSMSLLRVAFCSALVLELAASLSVAIVAVTVGVQLVHGGLTGQIGLATALFVLILAPEAYLPLRAVGAQYHASAEGLAAADRLLAVIEAPPEDGGGANRVTGAPTIAFRHTVFAYPGREPLPELHFAAPAGQITALTAPSGAGKSTLLAALLGFRTPATGAIDLDGADLTALDRAALRRSTAWMPQRPVLVDGTVADNVRLAVPDGVDDTAVQRAVARACAPDTARRVAASGAGVSAGEAARIGLARALLRAETLDCPILLLDEPTAHLDAATEQAVLQAITETAEGRTVLIASHRPAVRGIADHEVTW